ncbi:MULTISPECIES: NAD(P)-dependent oxidoreductase [unclassified Amycolatopsis]|uniref:NAD-dependent epimerase/dehydratase family protein n=1 Tax=unclassified Amycolatopsis TaxID=2618356 RepID=UPI001C69BBC9|nr:NAD-dependent epimerase/dehydratase family protein [Amycolatopsis sp. DSM 110486]QYN17795.1 NAD-dependent epimerase/dehydratase family protein [Amycolatopsis sp. DSM 110486]
MEIIGRGFLAQSHLPLAAKHPDVILVAAGPSSTQSCEPAEFEREFELMDGVLARAKRDDRQVVFFSTASHAMYGHTDAPATESGPSTPASVFGVHKKKLEDTVAASGVRWLGIRLSHAVGGNQRAHQLFPYLVRAVRSGSVRVFRDSHRDLLDIDDVVAAVDALLAAHCTDEVVNVASGSPYPVERLAAAIEAELGVRAHRETVDTKPMKTLVSNEKLRRLAPDLSWVRADEDYLRRLVAKYVSHY